MRLVLVLVGPRLTVDDLRCQAVRGWLCYPALYGHVVVRVPFWASMN